MSKQKLIMIVDDEQTVRDSLSGFFEKKGYETLSVPDGQSAVSSVMKKKPDIVLLDIKMPGMDGLETCYKIKQMLKSSQGTGIIIITGFGSTENLAKAFSSGAIDILSKPLDLEDLNNKIKTWIEIKNTVEESKQTITYIKKITGIKLDDK